MQASFRTEQDRSPRIAIQRETARSHYAGRRAAEAEVDGIVTTPREQHRLLEQRIEQRVPRFRRRTEESVEAATYVPDEASVQANLLALSFSG